MPFERIDLQNSTLSMDNAIVKVTEALRAGKLVVLPTETVYGLAALASNEQAVTRLVQAKKREKNHPMSLAFSGAVAVDDFATEMSELARRLARRCWPGPVSLVLNATRPGSEFHYLPENVKTVVAKGSTVCFRVPDHLFTSAVLADLGEPIVLTSANLSGTAESESTERIIDQLGADIDLLVDDGPLVSANPSTVLWIDGDRFSILRQGAVREETLNRLCARMILFVCTGNTCRSPMAERICEGILARRFGCPVDELEKHGFVVLSAGLAAGHDSPASQYSANVVKQLGLDLSDHRSQQLNENHVRFADHIFTMTRNHREAILSLWPHVDTRLSVLRTDGADISDPIGGSMEIYLRCAKQLEEEIEKRLDSILQDQT